MTRVSFLRALSACVIFGALASTAPRAIGNDILISEFRVRGPNGGSDEFIELYNVGSAPVSIGGWTIKGSNNSGTTSTRATISAGVTVNPGCFYLLTNSSASGGPYSGSVPGDQTYSTGITDDGGIAVLTGGVIVDQVGMSAGSAYKEGTILSSLGSANTNRGYERKPGGVLGHTDSDNNNADFQLIAPSNPRNRFSQCVQPAQPTSPSGMGSAAPSGVSAGDTMLLALKVTPGANPTSSGIAVTGDLSAIGGDAAQQFFDDGTNGDATSGDLTFSFQTVVTSTTPTGSFSLPVNIADAQSRTATAAIPFVVQPPPIPIHAIQGNDSSSPLTGQLTTTTGVVTAVKKNGFFMQAPDAEADDDPGTSEGLFVFTSTTPAVAPGDGVRVSGTVTEYRPASDPQSPPLTELGFTFVSVLSSGNGLPSAVQLHAADTTPAGGFEQLERFEGMRVRADLVVVSPTRSYSQSTAQEAAADGGTSTGEFYGVINGVTRPLREPGLDVTETLPPNPPCCIPRFDGNPERLRVDSAFNAASVKLDVAAGQVFSNFTGVLDYGYRSYTILPDAGNAPPSAAPAATPVPTLSDGEFTIGSLNMQHFYDTVNDPDSDVALSEAAFARRLAKASMTIRDVLRMPDVLGVVEAENIGVLQAIADRVNADAVAAGSADPGYVALLEEGNDISGIDVGVLLKGSRVDVAHTTVTQVGKDASYIQPDGTSDVLNDRPPLVVETAIVSPTPLATPYAVTVIVNHLRSLNGIDDPVDGPRVRAKRKAQAEYLAKYIQKRQTDNPHERIVSVGDYNALQFNDGFVDVVGTILGVPTDADHVVLASDKLVDPVLADLVDFAPPSERYSYMFGGNPQAIDHLIVTQAMLKRFSRIAFGRSNADFPETYRALGNRPERLSDHDAPIGYFAFPSAPIVKMNGNAIETVEAYTSFADPGAIASDEDGSLDVTATGSVSVNVPGDYTIRYTAANGFLTTTVTRTVHVVDRTPPAIAGFTLTPADLGAPNHKLVSVVAHYTATDASGIVTCALSVVSSEPSNGIGDGNTAGDWLVADAHRLQLRAERSGRGPGRTYTVTATCADGAGNSQSQSGIVFVNRDAR